MDFFNTRMCIGKFWKQQFFEFLKTLLLDLTMKKQAKNPEENTQA